MATETAAIKLFNEVPALKPLCSQILTNTYGWMAESCDVQWLLVVRLIDVIYDWELI